MRVSPLLRYLLRRLVLAVVLVFLVSSASLLLTHLAPGDAATDLVRPGVDPATVARERARLGLDRPFGDRYVEWLSRAVRLDLGHSVLYGRSVTELIGERARNTAVLGVSALLVASVLGIGLGVAAGSRTEGPMRAAIGGVSLVALSVPPLLASLALALVAARTGWFPVGGMRSAAVADLGMLARAGDVIWHLVLPTMALAVPLAATIERLQSQAMEATLREPYVRAATARGIPRRRVIWRHAFPVAVRPVLGVYGVLVGSLLSGSFVVEIVTAWPGLGQLMYEALVSRDTELVAGCVVIGSTFLAAGNLLADAALLMTDPRLRTGG